MTKRTYFGLEIVSDRGVLSSNIARLPFAAFWEASAARSAQIKDTASGEWLIHLRDWVAFSELFISTGRHRNMPRPPEVLWFDREDDEPEYTYFGLEVMRDKFVRETDIQPLPFYEFWRESSKGSASLTDTKTGEHLIYRHDWAAFSQLFIKTGRHRFMAGIDDGATTRTET